MAFFFWNDHKPLADPSAPCSTIRANQKKSISVNGETFLKDLQGFLWFSNTAITFYSMQFALCSQGGKATGLGCLCVHVCVCLGKENAGWVRCGMISHNLPKRLRVSNISEICLISVTLLSVLLVSKRSPLAEMQFQTSRMVRYLIF